MSQSIAGKAPHWLPKPRSGNKFKITLWLDPGTYFMLMRKSAELEAGEISVHKWLKKTLHLESAARDVQNIDGRDALPTVLHMRARAKKVTKLLGPVQRAAAARRPRQARQVAA